MTALLLAIAIFGVCSVVGLGLLVTLRADTSSLRVVLTAPAVGSAPIVLALFFFSHAGLAIDDVAAPVVGTLFVASAAALLVTRPHLHRGVLGVLGACAGGLLLTAWPMFSFGFDWVGNGNDDMANYVLLATQLLHHGLVEPLDFTGLANDRNFASATQTLHNAGARPGADLVLATLSSITGRKPYDIFMPLIVAMNLGTISAGAALAMQAARRSWAAVVAAVLLAVSPLATYGVVQQLLPQVWGLGIAAALCALVMRPELHRGSGPTIAQAVLIGLVAAAMIVVYVELAATVALIYAIYVGVLVARRDFQVRAAARLWGAAAVITLAFLNTYLLRELHFVGGQANAGVHGIVAGPATFAFTLVPNALPQILGLQTLAAGDTSDWSIVVAIILLGVVLVAVVATAARGVAASIALVAYLGIGIVLAVRESDFGLFKLYMYIQPFIAAGVAVWLFKIRVRVAFAVAAAVLAWVVYAQLSTQRTYVNRSRDPIELRHASDPTLLPAFRRFFSEAREPVISVTENPTLVKLEAASVGNRPLYFIAQDIFRGLSSAYRSQQSMTGKRKVARLNEAGPWQKRSFDLLTDSSPQVDPFEENVHASALLESGRCVLVLPSGSQGVFNRRSLPEGSPNLVAIPCRKAKNLLAFTKSNLGEGFYLPHQRRHVAFYQLESDYFVGGHTFAGFGRRALFRVLGPSRRFRLAIDLTRTLSHDGSNTLPPAAVVGAERAPLPLVGRGSARVFSEPLHPQMVEAQPYVLLDLGIDGRLTSRDHTGLRGLYGPSVVDPRYLTSYVRDVSLVSDADYRRLKAPGKLSDFPADLSNSNLEYSGIYEDGWMGEEGYAVLAEPGSLDVALRAEVPTGGARHLRILVDGRQVLSRTVEPGALDVRAPFSGSGSKHRVELRWEGATSLPAPDLRPVSAELKFLGLVARGG
jgi:hypothetical protein